MPDTTKKKILITGATGFIGKYIVEQALQRNCEVFLALRKESDTARIDHLNFKRVLVDYSSEKTIDTSFDPNIVFDTVVHNAGVKSCLYKSQYYRYNTELTKNLCKVLFKKKILKGNLIYISSLAALGPGDDETLKDITETKIEKPISHYGRSKLLAEKQVLKSGLDYIILRPTAVYGTGTSDYKDMIKMVKRGWAIYLAKPSQLLSFVHAEDLAKAVFLTDKFKNGNEIFNVSDGNDYTLASFYEIIATILGVKIKYGLRIPFFAVTGISRFNQLLKRVFKIDSALDNVQKAKEVTALNWRCSAEKLKRETDFGPSHTLREIID